MYIYANVYIFIILFMYVSHHRMCLQCSPVFMSECHWYRMSCVTFHRSPDNPSSQSGLYVYILTLILSGQ